MKTVALRVVAMALFGALAFSGFAAVPAGASTSVPGEKFAGTYRVHIKPAGGDYGTFSMVLLVNGTGTDSAGDHIVWSHIHLQFSFTAFDLGETFFVTGHGTRNADGFSSRAHPGTIFRSDGSTAVWYAVKIKP